MPSPTSAIFSTRRIFSISHWLCLACGILIAQLLQFFTISSASDASSRDVNSANYHHDVYWNSSNPLFSLFADSDDAVLKARIRQRINFHCPFYQTLRRAQPVEYSIIYRVSKSGYDNCFAGTDAQAVGQCNAPFKQTPTVITMRLNLFTPSPMGLEFRAGETYYFISTSSGNYHGLGSRKGGLCSEKNMRLKVEVLPAASSTNPEASHHQHPALSSPVDHDNRPQFLPPPPADDKVAAGAPPSNFENRLVIKDPRKIDDETVNNPDAIKYEIVQKDSDSNHLLNDEAYRRSLKLKHLSSLEQQKSSRTFSSLPKSVEGERSGDASPRQPTFFPRPWSVLWQPSEKAAAEESETNAALSSSQNSVLWIVEEDNDQQDMSISVNSANGRQYILLTQLLALFLWLTFGR